MEEQVQSICFSLEIINYIGIICLIIGLLSKKYIGLECVLTLQLVFYSQLLVENANKWPMGF